jgi:hypothetical protein
MRYNATSGKMEYCNGVALTWAEMSSPVTVAYDYGSSTTSYTSLASGVKLAWGRVQIAANTTATISNPPFTTRRSPGGCAVPHQAGPVEGADGGTRESEESSARVPVAGS